MYTPKIADPDLEKRRPAFLKIGFIAASALALMAFEYTVEVRQYDQLDIPVIDWTEWDLPTIIIKEKESDIEVEPVTEKQTNSDKIRVVEKIEKLVQKRTNPLEATTKAIGPEPKNPIGPKPKAKATRPYLLLPEIMPYYKSCRNISDTEERKRCTEERFYQHVKRTIDLPSRMEKKEFTVVYFVVNEEGFVDDVKLLKDVSPDLESEITRVVRSLPKLEPGMQAGRPVPVGYRMPLTLLRL